MKSTHNKLIVLVVLVMSMVVFSVKADLKCLEPQKGFYMSYNALSKRDTMTDLFIEVNTKMSKYNATYSDGKGGNYVIRNLLPQFYYNQHHQNQIYVDPQHVNVTLGDVQMGFRFDFNITGSGKNQSGWGMGRVLLDQTTYFVKRLIIVNGYLEWDPTEATNLTITYPITIEHSQPALQYDQKSTLQLMLNDHVSGINLRSSIIESLNEHYKVNLKQHLNKQDIIGSLSVNYTYKNIKLNFVNAVKNYTLSNNQVKGLQAFFFFEVENKTENCTADLITFDQKQNGGLQQVYSISSFREAFKNALDQGLIDTKLDRKWDVPAFQFYMGDLANAVGFAENAPAEDPFEVSCRWNRNKSQVNLSAYDNHELYAVVGIACTIQYKSKQIIQMSLDVSFVVRIYGEDDSLTFYIEGANTFAPQYKSLDPNYKVTNEPYARYAISRVIQGLAKTTTIGTGFKTSKRRFPSTQVTGDYIIVFDPSEI